MSCVQECVEIINPHNVGSLTIPRASLNGYNYGNLRAHTLNMHSYSDTCSNWAGLPGLQVSGTMWQDKSRPMGGFIPAECLVQNGTAGENGTAGGTLNQPVLGFW